jgi:hypothetical protein
MHSSTHALLHGPYQPPGLRRGGRTVCLYRDAEVVITSWTDARIPWPRCQAIGVRGGSGLLVTEELVRAIRTESSCAIQHWWGIREETVWRWRKAFGVSQWGTEGSRRLHQVSSARGAARMRGKKLPKKLVQRRIEVRRELGILRAPDRWGERRWQAEELDLLGTAPDAELAARLGRTVTAVRVMRNRLGRRQPDERRVK